jgi:alpha-tubulin suppressor-like RCC1 family protein
MTPMPLRRPLFVLVVALAVIGSALVGPARAVSRTVSLHTTAASYKVGSAVTLTGAVAPKAAASVTVQALVRKKWITVGHGKSSAKGAFALSVKAPSKPATWTLRAMRPASGRTKAVVSKAIKVNVVSTAYTVVVSPPSSVTVGNPMVVTGVVVPAGTGQVLLQSRQGSGWVTVATSPLGHGGAFTVGGSFPLGTYQLRVFKPASTKVAQGVSGGSTAAVGYPPLTVTTTSLSDATSYKAYQQQLTASGGLPPYHFAATGLPAGLTITAAGFLAGTATAPSAAPVTVTVTDARGVNASVALSLHVLQNSAASNQLFAWGYNGYGALGTGGTDDASSPRAVGLTGVVAAAGSAETSYALRYDGTVWAFGTDLHGALGDGHTGTVTLRPQLVPGLPPIKAVTGSGGAGYALATDGTVWAWGYNGSGELGDGTTNDGLSPRQVAGLTGVVAVAGSNDSAYALKADGTVWAWGRNLQGELGDGTTVDRSHPVQVLTITGVTAIAAHANTASAVLGDGTVWDWGANGSGQLGDGTTTERHSPVRVTGLTGVVQTAVSRDNSYALTTDGRVHAWGAAGGLGNGAVADSSTPVVSLVPTVTAIVGADAGCYALLSDGTEMAWGANGVGQLGNNTTTASGIPVVVEGLARLTAIGAGILSGFAVQSS